MKTLTHNKKTERDDVIVSYPHCKGIATEIVSAMKIRVLPLEWFYAAP